MTEPTSARSLPTPRRLGVWGVALLLLATVPMLSACDDEELMGPEPTDERFARVVTLGNSLTAGFQGGGISAETQNESFAVLLADQMDTPFQIPALADPGCPPPVTNILNLATGNVPTRCAFRESPTPTVLNNVAVPGARVLDALSNDPTEGASPNPLTTFILGGRTQVQAAAEVNPTFASVWLGNNDVLGAALQGDTDLLTDEDDFRTRITQVLDELQEAGAEEGVILQIANPLFTPNLAPAPAYVAAESQINTLGAQQSDAWGRFEVTDSCAPGQSGEATRIPFGYAFGTLFAQALEGATVTLDCDPASAADPLLTPLEQADVVQRLNAFNAILSAQADERGWAFVPVNPSLEALFRAGTDTPQDPTDDLVPKIPNPAAGEDAFGTFFTTDGVHPSAETHRVVTNLIVEAINAEYGTSLETIDAPSVPSPQE